MSKGEAMSDGRKNPYEYCKEHKTISVRTPAGCPLCLQAELDDAKTSLTGWIAVADTRKLNIEQLIAELASANHDYAELMKERADYVDENTRLHDLCKKHDRKYKGTKGNLAVLRTEIDKLENIIVRFKAECKITGKGPVDKQCEMVRLIQGDLETQTTEICRLRERKGQLHRAQNILQAELDTHRWIPVGERLPETITTVWILLQADDGLMPNMGFYEGEENGVGWDILGPGILSDVTHWKPILLPKGD